MLRSISMNYAVIYTKRYGQKDPDREESHEIYEIPEIEDAIADCSRGDCGCTAARAGAGHLARDSVQQSGHELPAPHYAVGDRSALGCAHRREPGVLGITTQRLRGSRSQR